MQPAFHDKANRLFSAITNDPRWDINDELLFQVAGFTFYGYCFGFGRLVCLMDADDIDAYVSDKLTGLGAGRRILIEDLATVPQMRRKGCAALLLHLGQMAYAKQLWGKAQGYLEASLQAQATPQARLVLAKVFDEMDKPEQAEQQRQLVLTEITPEDDETAAE